VINISRRKGESIEIGGDVRVVMLGVKGNRVSIGILAPDETHIERIGRDGSPQKLKQVPASSTQAVAEGE
jgi:carbon storage regulator CsrA